MSQYIENECLDNGVRREHLFNISVTLTPMTLENLIEKHDLQGLNEIINHTVGALSPLVRKHRPDLMGQVPNLLFVKQDPGVLFEPRLMGYAVESKSIVLPLEYTREVMQGGSKKVLREYKKALAEEFLHFYTTFYFDKSRRIGFAPIHTSLYEDFGRGCVYEVDVEQEITEDFTIDDEYQFDDEGSINLEATEHLTKALVGMLLYPSSKKRAFGVSYPVDVPTSGVGISDLEKINRIIIDGTEVDGGNMRRMLIRMDVLEELLGGRVAATNLLMKSLIEGDKRKFKHAVVRQLDKVKQEHFGRRTPKVKPGEQPANVNDAYWLAYGYIQQYLAEDLGVPGSSCEVI